MSTELSSIFNPTDLFSSIKPAEKKLILLDGPCNSGKTYSLINSTVPGEKTIFLSPTNALNIQITEDFKAKGFLVYNTKNSDAYNAQSNTPYADAEVACMTYHSFQERFKHDYTELNGVRLICDEAHELLSFEWQDILEFIQEVAPYTNETLLVSATMQYADQSIIRDKKGGYQKIKTNTIEYETRQHISLNPGPSAKTPEDISIIDRTLSQIVKEIKIDRIFCHRLAVQSLKTLNWFYNKLSGDKNILVICSEEARLRLTNKYNQRHIIFYEPQNAQGLPQTIDQMIEVHNINVILHTSALESGNNIYTPHICWYIAKNYKDSESISWSNVIQSVNRYRGQALVLDQYRLVFGKPASLSRNDYLRILRGEWLREKPMRILHFNYNIACNLIALEPQLFQPLMDIIDRLEWYNQDYGTIEDQVFWGSTQPKKISQSTVIDAVWLLLRGAYLADEQNYFDRMVFLAKHNREYNPLVLINKYMRYYLSLQIEKDSPFRSTEYDMDAGFAAIFLHLCERPDLFLDFMEARKKYNLKNGTNALIHGLRWENAIVDAGLKEYFSLRKIYSHEVNNHRDIMFQKYFGVEALPPTLDVVVKGYGRGIHRMFTWQEQRVIRDFYKMMEHEDYLGRGNFYAIRQHDGLRIYAKPEELNRLESEYNISSCFRLSREDYQKQMESGYRIGIEKGEDRTVIQNPNFFMFKKSTKGMRKGMAKGMNNQVHQQIRKDNADLRQLCINYGITNGKGKCRKTALAIWEDPTIKLKNRTFNSFYKWYKIYV